MACTDGVVQYDKDGNVFALSSEGLYKSEDDGETWELIDKSFLTDKVWFNANTGEIRYQVEESEVPAGYIENMHRLINTRFTISSDILNAGYYNFVCDKGEVNVGVDSWKGNG